MEIIDLTFYNKKVSIYRYIIGHMYAFYLKKHEYNSILDKKYNDILRLFSRCNKIIELMENICNNNQIPNNNQKISTDFEYFGGILDFKNIYENLLEYFPTYDFLMFVNISRKDVQKIKKELLYINVRFILNDNKGNILLSSNDI